jgi:hypothetical protein
VAYADEVLADSPYAYWRLDDTSGTTATDTSGNGRTGTYSGTPTLDQGPLIQDGRAVLFDATDDYCLSTAAVFNSSQATIEVWFDYDGTLPGANQAWLIAGCVQGDGGGTTDKIIVIRADGKPSFYVFDNPSGKFANGASALTAGIRHLVGTFDGSNIKIWVDGAEAGATAAASTHAGYGSPNLLVAGDASVNIGADSAERKAGRRDEFAVYSSFIGADRIAAHYQAGLAAALTPAIIAHTQGARW